MCKLFINRELRKKCNVFINSNNSGIAVISVSRGNLLD